MVLSTRESLKEKQFAKLPTCPKKPNKWKGDSWRWGPNFKPMLGFPPATIQCYAAHFKESSSLAFHNWTWIWCSDTWPGLVVGYDICCLYIHYIYLYVYIYMYVYIFTFIYIHASRYAIYAFNVFKVYKCIFQYIGM